VGQVQDGGRADEGDAFAARLTEELPRLVRLATRLLSDADVAEDCAQNTIVGAWRRRDQLRDPAALPAWLRRSLVNRIAPSTERPRPPSRPVGCS